MEMKRRIGGIFLALCLIAIASAETETKYSPENDENVIDLTLLENLGENGKAIVEAFEVLLLNKTRPEIRDTELLEQLLQHLDVNAISCSCKETRCECCHRLRLFFKTFMSCLAVTHYHHSDTMRIEIRVLNLKLLNRVISARRPPAICVGFGFLRHAVKGCFNLYNLRISGGKFSGCANVEVRVLFVRILRVGLGCFTMPDLKVQDEFLDQGMAQNDFLDIEEGEKTENEEKAVEEEEEEEEKEVNDARKLSNFLKKLIVLNTENSLNTEEKLK